jgi:hypothetical protein
MTGGSLILENMLAKIFAKKTRTPIVTMDLRTGSMELIAKAGSRDIIPRIYRPRAYLSISHRRDLHNLLS